MWTDIEPKVTAPFTDADLVRKAADCRKLAAWPATMTPLFVETQLAAAACFEELRWRRRQMGASCGDGPLRREDGLRGKVDV